METGAYDKDWDDIHMMPEETVQAHIDLKGKVLMPVHNGTFDLAFHAWYEPLERLSIAAHSQNVDIATPIMGESLVIGQPRNNQHWWRQATQKENQK